MCNDVWHLQFPYTLVKVFICVEFSDHHSILISFKDLAYQRPIKSFKFECAWVLEESYDEMMLAAWDRNNDFKSNMDNDIVSSNKWNITHLEVSNMKMSS